MKQGTFQIELVNEHRVLAELRAIIAKTPAKTAQKLHSGAQLIMARSKAEFVPVKTGALRNTGAVDKPHISREDVYVDLKYGGPAAPYAVVQHERIEWHHAQGQAKYLETPALQMFPAVVSSIKVSLIPEILHRVTG